MAICRRQAYQSLYFQSSRLPFFGTQVLRHSSSAASATPSIERLPASGVSNPNEPSLAPSPLERLPTSVLLRRMFMCSFFTSSLLFTPGLYLMKVLANTKVRLFNPDENRLLRKMVKPLVYDQFCAGTNSAEVHQTATDIKSLGFSGVVLCYSKEAQAETVNMGEKLEYDPELVQWRDGTLATLDMVGQGDWLGIKMTGAGSSVMQRLIQNQPPTPDFVEAMDSICAKAAKQNCRVWIDAEQQAVQKGIDNWTVDLMRKWNRGSRPVVYNTMQSYLKQIRPKLQYQLQLSQTEGWTMAIKLVRGAYIALDKNAVHDTKPETDASYEGLVNDLLSGSLPGFSKDNFPKFEVILAGHNPGTVKRATELAQELCRTGQLKVRPDFAQLQGMGDDVGLNLIHTAERIRRSDAKLPQSQNPYVPHVYKCLTWGTIQECMQYLIRRAIENRSVLERIKDDATLFKGEFRRRLANTFRA